MAATPQRPRQVTLAGWMIVVGSAVVVFSAFERVSGLRSIESQEAVADFVSEPPGDGLGLSVDQVLDLIQMLSLVAAACATAAAILGVWVLKGSKQARLALAVLALPLLVTGLATGGIVSSLVAVAAVMLWVQPARNWFEGRPPPTPPVALTPPVAPQAGQPAAPPPAAPAETPPAPPPVAVPWPPPPVARPTARPPAVIWACVLTWVCCGLVVVGLGLTVLVLLVAPDLLFDELHRQNPDLADQGLTDSEIKVASFVTAGLFVPWALVAAGFAVQAFRRLAWGRRALMLSAGAAGVVSLLGLFASAVMVLPFVAAVVTVALLSRPEVRAWYAAPPPGPGPR
ncbi:MAG TPA: hypothetical protein VFO49_05995 [Nocardioides sp.]|nr:hypothetical protein [Nocardioides sp.]